MSVDAQVGEEGDLVFNSECDREPVKGFEEVWCWTIMI